MWLLPSLNRTTKLTNFCRAAKLTGTRTPGIILVDAKDYLTNKQQYREIEIQHLPAGWKIHVTDGISMGDKIREYWSYYKDAEWVGVLNDDHIPKTAQWDSQLIAQLTGNNFISCNDHWMAPRKAAGATVWSGNLVRAVGWLFPEGLRHLYIDDIWECLGRSAGCWQVDMRIVVEHRHVLNGAPEDSTHAISYDKELWDQDRITFEKWLTTDAEAAIERIRALTCKVTTEPSLAGAKQ